VGFEVVFWWVYPIKPPRCIFAFVLGSLNPSFLTTGRPVYSAAWLVLVAAVMIRKRCHRLLHQMKQPTAAHSNLTETTSSPLSGALLLLSIIYKL